MASLYYDNIEKSMDYINSLYGRSFEKMDSLKKENKLNKLLEYFRIDKSFKSIFTDFIKILNSPLLENYPEYKKIKLYENDLFDCFIHYGYELSLYFDNKEAYRNFPLFFHTVCKKYNIDKYSNMSLKEIDLELNKYIDMEHGINPNSHKYDVMVVLKSIMNKDKYNMYYNNRSLLDEQDIMFIGSEEYTRDYEDFFLKFNNNKSIWVSKEYGDGYGYDILSYEMSNDKEKLIEVKSGQTMDFTLTKNEYKKMLEVSESEKDNYYIYKYTNINKDIPDMYIYKYDKENDVLVDEDNNIVLTLTPNQYYDQNKKRVVEFYATVKR